MGISLLFGTSRVCESSIPTGETPEIIDKIDSEQNFMIFSNSASVLQGISNSCTMNNTSHITQMLKDKTETQES
jgi:hypothetical protein